jgi:hypothetical protein
MAYTIVKTDGTVLTTIPDGTINTTSTSIGLPGRNFAGYGQALDTNFVHTLENFAASTPPGNPLRGQLWFNTNNSTLYVCPADGTTSASNWLSLTSTSSGGTTTFGNVSVTGNISCNNLAATSNVSANLVTTNFLTISANANIANASIANANVTTLLTVENITSGAQTTAGNLTGGWTVNGSVTGNALVIINGNLAISNSAGANLYGIKTDRYMFANGSPVSFAGTYSNANVQSFLPTYSGNVGNTVTAANTAFIGTTITTGADTTAGTITGTWTITGNTSFTGANVSLGSNANVKITGGSTGQVLTTDGSGNLSWVPTGTATTAQTVTNNAQPNITSTGTLTEISVSGNASFTGANVSLGSNANVKVTGGSTGQVLQTDGTGNLSWVTPTATSDSISNGTSNVSIPAANGNINLVSGGNATMVVTGTGVNVAGTVITGAGTGGNISGANVVSANLFTGTLTTADQPNITSVGTLTSLGVSGTVTASAFTANTGIFTGNGSGLSAIAGANVTGTVANATFATTAGSISSIPSGTRMLFAQTSAPTGWTKQTSNDNSALRVVSGTAGSGGSLDFTAAFTTRSVTGTVGDTSLTVDQMPSHTHQVVEGGVTPSSPGAYTSGDDFTNLIAKYSTTTATGNGESHSHTFSGTSIDIDVKYVDVIIAQKD